MKRRMKLLVPLLIIIIPVVCSMIYFDVLHNKVPQTFFLKHNGEMIASSPIPPGAIWFGTDKDGYHMFFESFAGLRITVLFIIGIALVTFVMALVLGAWLAFRKGMSDFITDSLLTSYYFIPQAIIAYILLAPVIMQQPEGFIYSVTFRVCYTVIVLALVLLPTTVIVVRDEIRHILKREFIECAQVLGAGKIRLLLTHVLPNIRSRLILILVRLNYQALMVMAHISFLSVFFGGTKVCYGAGCPSQPTVPFIRELSSLLGYHMRELYSSWWTFMVPLIFVVILLICLQLIADALDVNKRGEF